jgi:hypothetical protein
MNIIRQFVNGELRKLDVEGDPRVGTRVERAEEGRCEGEEGVGEIGGLKSCLSACKSVHTPSGHLADSVVPARSAFMY